MLLTDEWNYTILHNVQCKPFQIHVEPLKAMIGQPLSLSQTESVVVFDDVAVTLHRSSLI